MADWDANMVKGSCAGCCTPRLALIGVGASSHAVLPSSSVGCWQVALLLRFASSAGRRPAGRGGFNLPAAESAAAPAHQMLPGAAKEVTCWELDRPAGAGKPGWRCRLFAMPCAVGSGRQTLPWFSTVLFSTRVDPLRLEMKPAVDSVRQSTRTTLLNSSLCPAASWKRPSMWAQLIQKGPSAAAAATWDEELEAASRVAPAAAAAARAAVESDMTVTSRPRIVAGNCSEAGKGQVSWEVWWAGSRGAKEVSVCAE